MDPKHQELVEQLAAQDRRIAALEAALADLRVRVTRAERAAERGPLVERAF